MSKAKARLVLNPRVAKIIGWLTRNFDKEIGAIGIGEMKVVDGYPSVYVEELIFPKQEVTSATVSIKPESFLEMRKEIGAEKLNRMMFYWHRHPSGSAGCSGTDEEDTFDSFMNEKANRKFFAFLQTATSGTGMIHEARIDIREPIRVTIENGNIDLVVEKTDEDKEIEEFCNIQIEEKVTEKVYTTSTNYNYNGYGWEKNNYYNKGKSYTAPTKQKNDEDSKIDELFNADEPKLELLFDGAGEGTCYIVADKQLSIKLEYELRDDIAGLVRTWDSYEIKNNKEWGGYVLKPRQNCYKGLKTEIKRIYKEYLAYMKEKGLKTGDNELILMSVPDYYKIEENPDLIEAVTSDLYMIGYFEEIADKGKYIITQFIDYEDGEIMGDVHLYNGEKTAIFKGKKLVKIVQEITADILQKNSYDLLTEEDLEEEDLDLDIVSEPKLLEAKTDKSKKSGGKKNGNTKSK